KSTALPTELSRLRCRPNRKATGRCKRGPFASKCAEGPALGARDFGGEAAGVPAEGVFCHFAQPGGGEKGVGTVIVDRVIARDRRRVERCKRAVEIRDRTDLASRR